MRKNQDLPLIDKFGVNVKSKHEASERLNTPGMFKNHLGIRYVHTELVAEALLNIIGDFFKLFVSL